MFLNDPFFIGICFFSIGFLSIVGFTSLYLNFFFKSSIYKYYSYYVLSLLLFVVIVYIKNTGDFPNNSDRRSLMQLVVDGIQILSSYLFCTFIYNSMIYQDIKYKRLKKVYIFFVGFTIFYFIILFLSPNFVLKSYTFFIISRLIIYVISIVFYYNIGRELNVIYFRYIFIGITILFLSGFMAIWDSTVNYKTSVYTGFDFLCIGYFFENCCFMGALIYEYFIVEKEKKDIEYQHQEQLFNTQIEIQTQTMQHIGREIHDNIGQKLTLASLYTQQLAYENKTSQINGSIESISAIINQSLSELRELSKSLTDNFIDSNSISSLLESECLKINELKIAKVIFTTNANQIKLDYQRKSILLRITQEFIQNSIKHANCNNISISLHISNNLLQLKLADDGKGFDVNASQLTKSGIGLSNMKKRAELIGGKYDIQSNSNGTKIVVEIPISL